MMNLELLDKTDQAISSWMGKHCHFLMRISIAVMFIWFGILKPFGLSPEEELIKRTIYWLDPDLFLPILGWWEVTIGISLLYKKYIRFALLLLFILLPGTLLPLLLLPEICFNQFPFGSTLEGQYIIKNLILLCAAFVIGSKVRQQNNEAELV